ncbi:hypothetical protein EG329_007489 [Mollisiaceae sp. DMI_Dod_QoI]|nr:hypothetical protein EG329_007489 [Helotiales sp. DMI_Dod_QoI]
MDRPVKDIPGYYYDATKRKYFKIQGSTAPAGSAYSSSDVKRRKARDDHEEAQAHKVKREKGRIRRVSGLEDSLSGFVLKREFGGIHDLEVPRRILAAGLTDQGFYVPQKDRSLPRPEPLFNICPYLDGGGSVVVVHSGKVLVHLALSPPRFQFAHEDCAASVLATFNEDGGVEKSRPRIQWFGSPGSNTSLSTHDAEGYHAATWLSGSTERGIGIWRGLDPDPPGISFGPGVARGNHVNVFSSAAAPPESCLLFAFGTSRGILTLDKARQDLSWLKANNPVDSGLKDDSLDPLEYSSGDILSLGFLSMQGSGQNPFTLLCGHRGGYINRIDLRAPTSLYDRPSIFHGGAVTHIKQIAEHKILVCGTRSTMDQYDLRYLQTYKTLQPSVHPNPWKTKSYLDYPEYKNESFILTGFDVDMESGIVAVAQENDEYHPSIQLFSLHSGQALRSLETAPPFSIAPLAGHPAAPRFMRPFNPPSCLQFVKDTEGTMKSLYFSHRISIKRYAWGDEGETTKKKEYLVPWF